MPREVSINPLEEGDDEEGNAELEQAAYAVAVREGLFDPLEHDPLVSPKEREAMGQFQAALDQAIEATPVRVQSPTFEADASRRRSFIGAENKLRGCSGDDENFIPPDAGAYNPAPKPTAGFTVLSNRRRRKPKDIS
jgi:hypothetical protein